MKRFLSLLAVVLVMAAMPLQAQTSRELIKADPTRAANVHHHYEVPVISDTQAPAGYEPFYISHYGRHGSRYHWGQMLIDNAIFTLDTLSMKGLLTPEGEQIHNTITKINQYHDGQVGILTQVGSREHQGISQRMYERYTSVFNQKDRQKVVCIATESQRVIQSMGNFVMILKGNNPKLDISLYAGNKYKDILNKSVRHYDGDRMYKMRLESQVLKDNLDISRIEKAWFTDVEAAKKVVPRGDLYNFVLNVFNAGCITNCLDENDVDIYQFFNEDEIYALFVADNAYNHENLFITKENGHTYYGVGQAILGDFLTKADAALAGNDIAADLRFGHDTGIAPFLSLIGVDGFEEVLSSEGLVEKGRYCYNYVKMASNVQMIFYRNASNDVLVKILHDEKETHIPALKAVDGAFYKWSDLRSYFEGKMAL